MSLIKKLQSTSIRWRVLVSELLGYSLILSVIWVIEYYDLPYIWFHADPAPSRWEEALLESVCILVLAGLSGFNSYKLLSRIKHLEGFVAICAYCKNVRLTEDNWIPIEQFISDRSTAQFSHGYCPQCLELHRSELFGKK